MSFKVNSSQQISFNDSVFSLTAREKKALDNNRENRELDASKYLLKKSQGFRRSQKC